MNTTRILNRTATTLGLAVAALAFAGSPAFATGEVDPYRIVAPPTSSSASGGVLVVMGDGSVRFVEERTATRGTESADVVMMIAWGDVDGDRAGDFDGDFDVDANDFAIAGGGGGGSCWDWTDAETGETVTECH